MLSSDHQKEILALLEVISADPNAEAFLYPVDFEELGLLDYPDVVKHPMDL